MMTKRNLMRILEKLPDDVEITLCIRSDFEDYKDGRYEEIYASLEKVDLIDLEKHNIIYLEGTE